MSATDPSTSWTNMSSATKTVVVVFSSLGVALVVWLNFIR
jgi:hypothetical protein